MSGELVFAVDGSVATRGEPVSLATAGLRERTDLQEWVLANPAILGPDVFILTAEFDRWQSLSGGRERDRLDVLGIDSEGRLVVAELKRDKAPDVVEMQAIKYAALVSGFSEDDVVEQYLAFRARRGDAITEDAARARLLEHAGDLDPEVLRRPRIVLVAGAFPPVVLTSAVWLRDMGLDITLQRVQAYRVFGDRTVVTVSQFFPEPGIEDIRVSPLRAEIREVEDNRRKRREKSVVVRLVGSGELADGTRLVLRPTTEVTAEVRQAIEEWVREHPARGRATWHNDKAKPLEWAADGERYRPTRIVEQILREAAGLHRSVRGPSWWVLEDGRDLPAVAGVAHRSTFDWSLLHDVLRQIPAGRWTTYGDLAEVIGTAAQPLGQHLSSCGECLNAQRVLGVDGVPRPRFAWTDPDDHRTQAEALQSEGVMFPDGKAEALRRMSLDELIVLAGTDGD